MLNIYIIITAIDWCNLTRSFSLSLSLSLVCVVCFIEERKGDRGGKRKEERGRQRVERERGGKRETLYWIVVVLHTHTHTLHV